MQFVRNLVARAKPDAVPNLLWNGNLSLGGKAAGHATVLLVFTGKE
jgi:hypothetical protein